MRANGERQDLPEPGWPEWANTPAKRARNAARPTRTRVLCQLRLGSHRLVLRREAS